VWEIFVPKALVRFLHKDFVSYESKEEALAAARRINLENGWSNEELDELDSSSDC